MPPIKKRPDPARQSQLLADVQRDQAARLQSYRERALSLFPHVCGRCGREFAGKSLRELTVHHRDHDHSNNPPDGSNWELLCLYCHDNEHQDSVGGGYHGGSTRDVHKEADLGFRPFAGLEGLLKPDSDASDSK